jgi:hypothetical protein
MSRFNETKLNSTSGTVAVGAGLTWDQVYEKLEPTGVNVVGGRVSGIGVAGLTLGGGKCFSLIGELDLIRFFRLFLFVKSAWTHARQRCWI